MYKVIIAGTRSFTDYDLLVKTMDKLLKNKIDIAKPDKDIEIISGKASGADSLGEKYARQKGFGLKEFPADWKNISVEKCVVKENKYGKYNTLAGTNRNKQMADYADACVVFWDGKSSGSKNMIELARGRGIPVRTIRY